MYAEQNNTSSRAAAALCLLGFFLYVGLSDPLLNMLGYHYSGTDLHHFYERIHPGTPFIYLSFLVLLWWRGNLVHNLVRLARTHTVFVALLCVYIGLLVYLVLRSGAAGIAFLVDTHLPVPMAALVLVSAPNSWCRRALWIVLIVAAVNSAIGVVEGAGKFRLFTFDADWSVLHESYFRASALRGHPLVNAMFSSMSLFLLLSLRLPALLKALGILLFMASLVAFGSRSALAFTLLGLAVLMGNDFVKSWRQREQNPAQWLRGVIFCVLAPIILCAFVFVLLHAGIGDRLINASHWDDSANSRLLVGHVFDHLSFEEILCGVDARQVSDITTNISADYRFGAIENPWILMLVILGAPMFVVWFAATVAFALSLIKKQPLAIQMTVIMYYVIASTFNSFGVKDTTYVVMVCMVLCASRCVRSDSLQTGPDTHRLIAQS